MKKYIIPLFLFSAILILPYCTTVKKSAAVTTVPSYTYVSDVAPIIQARCTPCHFPETGKKKFLDTHEAVSSTIDDILYRVQLPHDNPKFMPFKNKKEPLSDSLVMVLKVWKEAGMK